MFALTPETLEALADPGRRSAAADRLAKSLGGDAAIVFAKDPTLKSLLPAIGFPQTLPSLAWRTFIAGTAQSEAKALLPYPDAASPPVVTTAVRGADGTLLVLIGAESPDATALEALRMLLPLLGTAYTNEFIARDMQRKVEAARETASYAQALALSLDSARGASEKAIRALKQAEDALATEKELLAVTLESIGDGVITCNTQALVVLINPAAQALTGWSLEAARGQPFQRVFNIVDEQTREPHESPVKTILHAGRTVEPTNHTVLIARDGTERIIANSGAPIRSRNGETVGAVLVFRDITDKRRAEDDLIKAQRLESIGLLAGGIAHDFNNILTAIFGNIALAKLRAHADPDVIEPLDEAESAFFRARGLSHQLLTFAKGGAPIRRVAPLGDLIAECVRFVLRDSNIRCDIDLDPSLWPVSFDSSQMSQVVNNLLMNAKEAIPHGGAIAVTGKNITLESHAVGALPGGRYVRLSVEDDGIGIPPHLLQKIFDPYFSTKEKSSGLGLTTTYSIIKRHDGHIAVESRQGAGTVFRLYLPVVETEPNDTTKSTNARKSAS